MNLTRASSYALHALVYMAQQKTEMPIASHKIAAERGIPERFLLKVLKPLVSHQVLESIKGPNGGYKLARSASDINILEILEAVEGGGINGFVPVPKKDPKKFPKFDADSSMSLHRKLDNMCKQSADLVRKHLEKIKLADISRR